MRKIIGLVLLVSVFVLFEVSHPAVGNAFVASTCGNMVCEAGETLTNCPEDCNFTIKPTTVVWSGMNLSEAQLEFAATNFYIIQIGESLVNSNIYPALKAYNSDVLLLGYINSKHIQPNTEKNQECEANELLFAYDASNNRIQNYAFGNYLMDISNPEWTDMSTKWANEHPPEADGIMFDTATPFLLKSKYTALPAGYNKCEYAVDMKDHIATVKADSQKLLVINGLKEALDYCDSGTKCSGCNNYLEGVDGGIIEGFIFFQGHQYTSASQSRRFVNYLIKAGNMGKLVHVSSKSHMGNINKRLFAIAAYLLGNSEYSSYSFVDLKNEFSAPLQYYPEYEINLGAPLEFPNRVEDLLNSSRTLAIRHFENGMVIVNPFDKDATIQVDGGFSRIIPHGGGPVDVNANYDGYLEYQEVPAGTLKVPANTAIILEYTY